MGVLVTQVGVELLQQPVAALGFLRINGRAAKQQVLADAAPELALDDAQGQRIGAEHVLRLLDLPAVLFRYLAELSGDQRI
jgi:hypothetical protein